MRQAVGSSSVTPTRRRLLGATAGTLPALAGCPTGESGESAPTPTGATTRTWTPTGPAVGTTTAYTHLRASGNRYLTGSGDLAGASPVALAVDGTPAWVLAAAADTGSRWTVVTEDGIATTYRVADGTAERVDATTSVWSPPVGVIADGETTVLDPPSDCADRSHPLVLPDGLVYVAADGSVVVDRDGVTARLPVDAPTDARVVAVDTDRVAVYGRRTDRYRHGALGDTTEGSSLVVVDAAAGEVAGETRLDAPAAFEGLSPLVADLDNDGTPDIVTTVATADDGARVRVYRPDGTVRATGPRYGPGWRHQLAVAPFAPGGVPELAVVRKPHVDRTLEFYRLAGGSLTIAATRPGYASHTYGSRNLDQALAADVTDAGRPALVVPTTDRRTLAVVRRTRDGTAVPLSLGLGGRLRTNVVAVAHDDGVAVGAGTGDGVRVWTG
jgi:hypothetical protein